MTISRYDQNLLLYYKFNEPSGTLIPNDAANAPLTHDDGNPLDLSLEWYSVPVGNSAPGIDGLYRIWAGPASGNFYPPQWGGPAFAASGHMKSTSSWSESCIRSISNFEGSDIAGALGSGKFTIAFWVVPSYEYPLISSDPLMWVGRAGQAQAFKVTSQTATQRLTIYEGTQSNTITIPLMSGAAGQGLWNHVAFSYDPDAEDNGVYLRVYLNDQVVRNNKFSAGTYGISQYLSFFNVWDASPTQTGPCAIKDFVLFNKILTSGEISDIFNNGISETPILFSTDADLILWYRFNEASGTPIRSWASNTPTQRTGGGALDTNLQWNNTPLGIDGVTSINTATPGYSAPYQWGEDRPTPSSTTVDLYHALQSPNMDDSSAVGTIASGSFSVGFWFNFKNVNDIFRLLFSFDRTTGDDTELALGFNTYNANRYRFVYNDGVGSLRYFYDLTNSGSGEMWNHVVITHTEGGDDDGKYARLYINSDLKNTITDPEFDALLSPYFLTFFNAHADYSDKQFKGAINDFGLFKRALNADEVSAWFNDGITLVTSSDDGTIGGLVSGIEGVKSSGIIGGYMSGIGEASGLIGGYVFGAYQNSGIIGGYMSGIGEASGLIGGYIFSADRTSGIIGGYMSGIGEASGLIGGYVFGAYQNSGIIGGYIRAVEQTSGVIGGFINGGIAGSGIFDAGFTVKALTANDFDALIEIKRTYNSDFDAVVDIYKAERWPFVSIKYPDGLGLAEGHDVSGVLAPLTPWFVASGIAVNGKTINKALWNFGDLSPVTNGIPSGNDEFASDHTYSTSGIYIATFRAIDSDGLNAADSIKIHLASGVPMPDVTLSANPMSGDAPLSVDFDYSITNIPPGVTITSKVLFLGNGKSTINPNVTYNYLEPGEYIPILVVLDSRNIITCDSLKINANN